MRICRRDFVLGRSVRVQRWWQRWWEIVREICMDVVGAVVGALAGDMVSATVPQCHNAHTE